MSAPYNATPGDVYRDANGNVWVVEWYCSEPTVGMRCVAGPGGLPPQAPQEKQFGGVNGLMWQGFEQLVPRGKTP